MAAADPVDPARASGDASGAADSDVEGRRAGGKVELLLQGRRRWWAGGGGESLSVISKASKLRDFGIKFCREERLGVNDSSLSPLPLLRFPLAAAVRAELALPFKNRLY